MVFKRFITFLLLFIVAFPFMEAAPVPAFGQDVKVLVGVLAKRGPEITLARWGPTAKYLTESIPGYRFSIVPLDFEAVRQTVEKKAVDFILTNSGYYIELESLYGVSRIATLKNKFNDRALNVFGGVIITRRDRDDINSLADLIDSDFQAVDQVSLGGWMTCRLEMKRAGVGPERGNINLHFGGTHDAVVFSVLGGQADAGCVRTDTLERMADEKRINLSDLKVLNSQYQNLGYPFLLSTALYPEWPWAKLRHTPDRLAELVAIALLSMSPEDEAARSANIAGWTVPLDYLPVHSLMKELKVGPYRNLGRIDPQDVLREYNVYILSSIGLLIGMVLVTGYVFRLNRRLTRTRAELGQAYEDLELRVEQRTAELSETNKLLLVENSERKKAEDELYRQNELVESIIRAASAVIITLDSDGRITRYNRYAEQLTGFSAAEAIGRIWVDLFATQEERDGTLISFLDWYNGPEPQWSAESGLVRRDGDGRTVSWQSSKLRDPDGLLIGALAIGLDVTQHRRAEEQARSQQEQLIQADKMVALGTLVAGVAHEINNPTTSIMMNAPNVEKMWNSVLPILEAQYRREGDFTLGSWQYSQIRTRMPILLEGISDGAKRVKRIVADLKDYARQEGAAGAVPVDVNRIVEKALSLLANLIKKSTRKFVIDYGDDLPMVLAQSQRLEQVVINLIMNACQALPDSSRGVFVGTSHQLESDRVSIVVSDEGSGIPESHLHRLTDPFFTTKRETGGTGLGLAICSRIVKDCGGTMIFHSQKGQGATVTVELPAVKPQ